MTEPSANSASGAEMERAPIVEHLRELKTRLIRMIVAIVLGFALCWFFHEELFAWLMEPYTLAMQTRFPELPQYIEYRSLVEPFIVYLKASLVGGVLLVVPYLLLELWLFVVPGLYAEEKKIGVAFLFFTVIFFFSGVALCRYFVLEPAVHVLLGIGATNTAPAIMMQEYFSFTTRLLFVFGLVFEMPVAISFLSMVGLITHHWLIKQWRIAVVIMTLGAAILTPPDPLTQIAMAVPLVLLYFLSIGIAYLFTKRRERRHEEASR